MNELYEVNLQYFKERTLFSAACLVYFDIQILPGCLQLYVVLFSLCNCMASYTCAAVDWMDAAGKINTFYELD